jgi:hypothetical protein
MAKLSSGPRKQRTRQHVIADISVHFVEGFILEEGYTARRLDSDYSYDLVLNTFDEHGFAEPGPVYFQVKASEKLTSVAKAYVFDLDIRDYNLWISEEMPVILVLFDASKRKAYWIAVQEYFDTGSDRKPKRGVKTVRIRGPKAAVLDGAAIQEIRQMKFLVRRPRLGVHS